MKIEFSNTDKRERLANIGKEVEDFHPLLHKIFGKLPRVVDVDHTHGNEEFGADFVITRKDDVSGTDEYIGVIVKVGKIHQDIMKICQQIKECDEERIGPGSKRKIRLDEIWVVNNESVTSGAKKNIHREFSTRKIKFYSSKDIIFLIDKYLENFWYEVPVGTGEYLKSLSDYIDKMEIESSLFSGTVVDYIEQDIIETDYGKTGTERSRKRKKQKVDLIKEINNNKVTFIEADAGFGKSKLLRHLAKTYCNPIVFNKVNYIPILISYKEIYDEYETSLEVVISKTLNGKFDIHETAPCYIIFIDGVDEKIFKNDEQLKNINLAIEQSLTRDDIKLVFATRPIGFLEGKDSFPIEINKYELQPLSIPKVVDFFNKFCTKAGISSRIIEDLKKSQLFKQLPKSPIATILLANLLNEDSQDLPSNLTELYSKYLELMLGRWDVSKGLSSQKEYESAKRILCDIASYFIENDLTQISVDEASGFFDSFLGKRNLGIDPSDLFEKIVSRSGVVCINADRHIFHFKHRTFCEYFYALNQHENGDDSIIDNRIFNYYWRNIFFFYVGLKSDCENTLIKMIKVDPAEEIERFLKVFYMSDYLLAGYASPYSIVEEALPDLFIEASTLYMEIANNETDTPMNGFSQTQLLWFFQALIKHQYSFNHYSKAIVNSVLEIYSRENVSQVAKINALFFLATTSAELGDKDPFDFLIKNYGKELSVLLGIGISNEGKRLEHISSNLKNYLKKFDGRIKKSHETKLLTKKLFNEPINVQGGKEE